MNFEEAYNLLISWDEWRPYSIENKYERHKEICEFLKYRPERLSPEDHIVKPDNMICDSPNTANK